MAKRKNVTRRDVGKLCAFAGFDQRIYSGYIASFKNGVFKVVYQVPNAKELAVTYLDGKDANRIYPV